MKINTTHTGISFKRIVIFFFDDGVQHECDADFTYDSDGEMFTIQNDEVIVWR